MVGGPDGSAEFDYLDFVGLSAEQASDRGWTRAVHPDDLDGLSRWLHSATRERQRASTPARDGEYRWIFRANPLLDEQGEIVKWYGDRTSGIERVPRRSSRRRTVISPKLSD